jgi:aspartate/tyrosine/aromatic aminotransferase
MFAFTGLNADHVKRLIDEYHIYLLSSGRISMAGLNEGNVGYVAKAFDAVTRNSKI